MKRFIPLIIIITLLFPSITLAQSPDFCSSGIVPGWKSVKPLAIADYNLTTFELNDNGYISNSKGIYTLPTNVLASTQVMTLPSVIRTIASDNKTAFAVSFSGEVYAITDALTYTLAYTNAVVGQEVTSLIISDTLYVIDEGAAYYAPISDTTLTGWVSTNNPPSVEDKRISIFYHKGQLFAINGEILLKTTINPDGSLAIWQTVGSLPLPSLGASSLIATTNGIDYLYIIGGSSLGFGTFGGDTSTVIRSVFREDGSVSPWDFGPDMINSRKDGAAWLDGDYIYSFGGLKGNNPIAQSERIDVRTPFGLGFEINNGAEYTNQKESVLTVKWPADVKQIEIDNNGAFNNATVMNYQTCVNWDIREFDEEVTTALVYLRYIYNDNTRSGTQIDDILIDKRPPEGVLSLVEPLPVVVKASALALLDYRVYLPLIFKGCSGQTQGVLIDASDDFSGVADMAFGGDPGFTPQWGPFKAESNQCVVNGQIYARLRDRAGNVSEVFGN